ncbi:MAG: hypothetical protein ACR2LE_03430 [Nocardioidaceae bacterium]
MSEPFGGMPTRWDPDPGPSSSVVVILPGSGYSPAHPLLEFGRQSLLQHGWTVQQVWWDQPRDMENQQDTAEWVCQQADAALDTESEADRLLVLAKSLGTLASPVVAERGLDAIWMTPLFSMSDSIEAIRPMLSRARANCSSVDCAIRNGTRTAPTSWRRRRSALK